MNVQRRRRLAPAALTVGAVLLLVAVSGSGIGSAATKAAPVNTGEPTISGTPAVGATLTATTGSWSNNPTSFAYQWLRCPPSGGSPDGSDCAAIGGATTQSYVVGGADAGNRLRVRVTASNADGSAAAVSNATALVTSGPANTGEPRITGTARVGATLTATAGTWANNPTSFAYQWVRCPASGGAPDGSDCAAIGGATTQAYVVTSADVGSRLRVRVTASNASGSTTVASDASDVVAAVSQAPVNAAQPGIAGTPRVGSVVAATPGIWRNDPTAFAYQWRRCPASGGKPDASDCAVIGGATSNVYTPVAADVGSRLRVRVTASNGSGSAAAASNATAAVQPAPPPPAPPTGCPSGTGPIHADQLAKPARLLIDGQQLAPPVVTSRTGVLVARFHVSACGGRSVQGALVYSAAVPFNQFAVPSEQLTGADGWATLTMRRLRGFPAARFQHLLVLFVRARNANENPLGGVSSRRLVSFPVSLHR